MALLPSSGDAEDGSRAIFRNVIFIYLYFTLKTMDKVQKTNGSQCSIPSSEPFRIHLKNTDIANVTFYHI
jgi:hypothetical protein